MSDGINESRLDVQADLICEALVREIAHGGR
jgi:hypothetical protein